MLCIFKHDLFLHSSGCIHVQTLLSDHLMIRGEGKKLELDLSNISPVSMETVQNVAMVNLLDRHTCRAVCFES